MNPESLPFPLPDGVSLSERISALVPRQVERGVSKAFDRWTGERHRVEVERHTLEVDLGEETPDSLRVGLMSDFHYDPLCEDEFVGRCVELANQEEPDLVLLLGDFLSYETAGMAELGGILAGLRPRSGTFAIVGNHDHKAGVGVVEQVLTDRGIGVLRNRLERVPVGRGWVFLAGVESAVRSCPDFTILDEVPESSAALILAHEPDVFRYACRHRATALQVSGHTHGGQIRISGMRPPLLPALGRRYVGGLHSSGVAQLYVSRGLGTSHIHVRVGAPPEITFLELRNRRA